MKLRSDIIAVFLSIFVFLANISVTMQDLGLMKEIELEENEERLIITNSSSSGGGDGNTSNPLKPIDVGDWGLYLPDQTLSFITHQWVASNGEGHLYYSEVQSYPKGIVDTWIDGDYIYIQAKELGNTTVTANVYSESGYTMSNSVNIEVKIEPNPLYPLPQEDVLLYPDEIKGIHKTSWIGGFPVYRMWIERVEANNKGVVDTWIDGDSFYIKAVNQGETTVTAHVYTDYEFTKVNHVNVTVLEEVYGN